MENNKDQTVVTSNDLRNALDEILTDKEVTNPETHAIGCSIKWAK